MPLISLKDTARPQDCSRSRSGELVIMQFRGGQAYRPYQINLSTLRSDLKVNSYFWRNLQFPRAPVHLPQIKEHCIHISLQTEYPMQPCLPHRWEVLSPNFSQIHWVKQFKWLCMTNMKERRGKWRWMKKAIERKIMISQAWCSRKFIVHKKQNTARN